MSHNSKSYLSAVKSAAFGAAGLVGLLSNTGCTTMPPSTNFSQEAYKHAQTINDKTFPTLTPSVNAILPVEKTTEKYNAGTVFTPQSSWTSLGVNGLNRLILYSSNGQERPQIAVGLKVGEGNYNGWQNEQKASASLLIIPDVTYGDANYKPNPKTDLESALTLATINSADGKLAKAGLFGLGFYATSSALGPAGAAAGIEFVLDSAVEKFFTDRRVYLTRAANVPSVLTSTPDRKIYAPQLNTRHYALELDVNSTGKVGKDKFQPDGYEVRIVDLAKYGGKGQALEIYFRDHKMRENLSAIAAGLIAGAGYRALIKDESKSSGIHGTDNTTVPSIRPTPTPRPPAGIGGGDGITTPGIAPIRPGGPG